MAGNENLRIPRQTHGRRLLQMLGDGHLHIREVPQRIAACNDVKDFAFLADEEAHAACKVALGHSHAVGIGGLALDIGKQGKG